MNRFVWAGLSAVALVVSCAAPPPAAAPAPEPKPVAKVEPRPAPKPSVSPAKLKTVSFFEAPAAGAAQDIKPASRFPRTLTRNISYLLECEAVAGFSPAKKDFLLAVNVTGPDGLVQNLSQRSPMPSAEGPARIQGKIFDGTSKLKPGAYRAVFTADGLALGTGAFSVEPWFPVMVSSVEFFEGDLAGKGEKKKGTTFSKATTRAIHAVVSFKNGLAGRGDQSPEIHVLWRRGAGQSLKSEKRKPVLSGDVPTFTETFTFGWEEPGRWSAERLSFDVETTSGDRLGSYPFTIEDGCVALPADHPLHDITVKFFESGEKATEQELKQTAIAFDKTRTRFISALVDSKHRYYQKKDSPIRYRFIYFQGARKFGETEAQQNVLTTWSSLYFHKGLGWSEPGQWDAGFYRTEIWIDQYKVKDLHFEIKDDRPKNVQEAERLLKAAGSRKRWDGGGKLADLTQSIQLHPTVDAHVQRARVRSDRDDFEGAMADFSRALDLKPKAEFVLWERCKLLTRHEQKEGALADAAALVELNPSADNLRLRAETRSAFHLFAEAEDDLNNAVRKDPKNPDAYAERAALKKKMGRVQDNLIDLTIAIDLAPDRKDFYELRAGARFKKGDRLGATADLGKMLELSKDKVAALLSRAELRQRWGDVDGARGELQRAVDADPKSTAALQARADARRERGDIEGAIADYNAALLLDPKAAVLYDGRSKAKRAAKDIDGAAEDLVKALELEEFASYRLGTLMGMLLEKGDVSRALAECDRHEQRGAKLSMYDQRAQLFARMGKFTEAIQEIDLARKKSETQVWGKSTGLWTRSELYFRKGDLEAALQDSEALFGDNPWPHHHLRLVCAYYAAGRLPEALGVLRDRRSHAYSGQDQRLFRWIVRARLGEVDAATKELAERSSPSADESGTLLFLITDYLTGKLDEAQLVAQATKIDSSPEKKSLEVLDYYVGMKLLVQGEKAKALERLCKAVASESPAYDRYWIAVTELARAGRRPIGDLVLGIQAEPAPEGGRGVLVAMVVPGTYAERAGLLKGDVLLEVGGREVSTATLYRATIDAGSSPSIAVKLLRNGEERTVKIKP